MKLGKTTGNKKNFANNYLCFLNLNKNKNETNPSKSEIIPTNEFFFNSDSAITAPLKVAGNKNKSANEKPRNTRACENLFIKLKLLGFIQSKRGISPLSCFSLKLILSKSDFLFSIANSKKSSELLLLPYFDSLKYSAILYKSERIFP